MYCVIFSTDELKKKSSNEVERMPEAIKGFIKTLWSKKSKSHLGDEKKYLS